MRDLTCIIVMYILIISGCSWNNQNEKKIRIKDSIIEIQKLQIDSVIRKFASLNYVVDSLQKCIVTLETDNEDFRRKLISVKKEKLQKKGIVDMQIIKSQKYLNNKSSVNCDCQGGTMLEKQICINLELQKADSLLHVVIDSLTAQYDEDIADMLLLEQQYWEYYRYAYASSHLNDTCGSTRMDMILYMEKALQVTKERIKYLRMRKFNEVSY